MKAKDKGFTGRRILGVDLFSGAGGMSLGARWAGVEISAAIEADVHAAATFKINHPGTTVLNDRIESVAALHIKRTKRDRLIVFGGPPCQGFSTSNQRTRGNANPTNWLFTEYLRLVGSLMPDWVVFENVTGLAVTEKGKFLDAILSGFKKLGYSAESMVLNAEEYGVPQRRARLFILASLHHEEIRLPRRASAIVTVREAISDLPILRNGDTTDSRPYRTDAKSKYASKMRGTSRLCINNLVTRNAPYVIERFSHVPAGGNWSDIPASQMENYADPNRCHTGIYRRLDPRLPSVVIGNFRKNMLIRCPPAHHLA